MGDSPEPEPEETPQLYAPKYFILDETDSQLKATNKLTSATVKAAPIAAPIHAPIKAEAAIEANTEVSSSDSV